MYGTVKCCIILTSNHVRDGEVCIILTRNHVWDGEALYYSDK